jgi:hypothetical protein
VVAASQETEGEGGAEPLSKVAMHLLACKILTINGLTTREINV